MLPAPILKAVSSPAYRRSDRAAVRAMLERMGSRPSSTFVEFYENFAGPFGSSNTGYELLDVVDQETSIETQTNTCRKVHGFPDRYLVLSNLFGGAVLVYDCETDHVFNVDFEGGDQELRDGTLEPTWQTFEEFLLEYFAPDEDV